MTEITITLPLPDKCLSPNASSAIPRPVYYRAKRNHRADAMLAAIDELDCGPRPFWKRAEIKAVWFKRTKHKIDQGNASNWLKPYEDGFEDAGIYENDSGVIWAPHEFKVDKADPRIELTIRKLTPETAMEK